MASKNPRPHALQTKVNDEMLAFIVRMTNMLDCSVSDYLRYLVDKDKRQWGA